MYLFEALHYGNEFIGTVMCIILNNLFATGLGYGDPHYRTFDGRQYDFQGIGEFTLLELYESGAGDPIFSIHGRLGQPSGWRPGVSGHIGLAFGDPSLAYHVSTYLCTEHCIYSLYIPVYK